MPADEAPVAVGMPWQNAGAKASEIGAGMDEIWRFFCRISFSLVTLARQASCAPFVASYAVIHIQKTLA